ncbi:MAG: Uma2 family endonuclease [Verrucomicrobiales bacterium]
MNALLERRQIRERVSPLSLEAYHQLGALGLLEEDVELLQGTLIRKMPKSPLHEFVVQVLANLFYAAGLPGLQIRRDSPLTIGNSEPEPDLSIVQGKPSDWLVAHPSTALLVVEVAISSLDIDVQKAAIYASAGIPECWIVRPKQREVDIYRNPQSGGYDSHFMVGENQVIECASLPDLRVDVNGLFPAQA